MSATREPDPREAPQGVAIVLEGVRKHYAGRLVVDVERLEAAPHRTLALIGPSGCGKSTLLRLMIGLVSADAGTIHFGSERVEPASHRSIRVRTGYVIQDGGLFPHLTVLGNVALVARDLGWDAARIHARVAELGELARLPGSLLGRYPHELSGGQRQRVAVMRALMLDPAVLLMDEPLASLDPMIRAELQDELRSLFARLETTVVLVTHDLAEAAFLGDSIALLRDGRVVQTGSLDELITRPLDPFVTAFVTAQRALGRGERQGCAS